MQHDGLPGFTFNKPKEEEEEEEAAMRRRSQKAQRTAPPKKEEEEEEEIMVAKKTQQVQRSAVGFVKGLFSRKERLEVPGLLKAKHDACE